MKSVANLFGILLPVRLYVEWIIKVTGVIIVFVRFWMCKVLLDKKKPQKVDALGKVGYGCILNQGTAVSW